jgi:glycosyltransferase involved in cell wall biosynthesis
VTICPVHATLSRALSSVLVLSYHFPPIGGGGVQRPVGFVRHLPALGYSPTVVTGTGAGLDHWTPEDPTLLADVPSETPVHRVPGPEPESRTGWRRRVQRIAGTSSPFDRWWVEGAIEVGRRVGGDADLILGELVPYSTAEAAARLARRLGKPWVADLQDAWAFDEMWLYPTGLHRRRDLARMRRLLSTAAAVVTSADEAASRIRGRFPELAKPVLSIANGFDAADFAPAPPSIDGVFRIVHTGFFHTDLAMWQRNTGLVRRLLGGMPMPGVDFLARSPAYLLEAVDRLVRSQPALATQIEVHLAGAVSEADRGLVGSSPYVRVHGYLPHRRAVELMQSADLLFLPMHDVPEGTRAGLVPGKTYEYLAAGKPILAAVPRGDAHDILSAAGSALLCPPRDAGRMAAIIAAEVERRRAGLPAPQPRPEVVARYERRSLTGELAGVFDRVLAESPLARRRPSRSGRRAQRVWPDDAWSPRRRPSTIGAGTRTAGTSPEPQLGSRPN